jgi:RNA polymerase sigma-70 factor (ECF subfamily)
MANLQDSATTSAERAAWFTTTHWSIVLNAQDPASPQAGEALEKLCRAYWYPLYAFARRQGHDEAEAKDLTQGFFAKLLEKHYLADVRREKGKFRTFLLVSIRHFISDEWDKARALKRGGGKPIISLDETAGEDRYRREPIQVMDAEQLYERRWALTLLEQAAERLKEEYRIAGKAELYQRLQLFESGDKDTPAYAQVAPTLGLSESGLRSAVLRMRRRHRELVREEVAQTVNAPDEVDEEIRYLIRVVSG